MSVRYFTPGLLCAAIFAVTACSGDSGGPRAPSNSGSSTGSSGSSGGGAGTSGSGTGTASAGTGSGSTTTPGSSTAAGAGTGAGSTAGTGSGVIVTDGISSGGLLGTGTTLGSTTAGLTGAGGNIVPQTLASTGTLGTSPVLSSGPLVSTAGTGSGAMPLLTANTATPNGSANTTSVNLPSPVLGNTQVLPSGANSTGGPLLQTNIGANTGTTSAGTGGTGASTSGGGLVNGVLGSTGLVR